MWNNILNFVNSNGALWNFLVTIATIVYVILTYKLLRETTETRKSQNRPYIIADMELNGIYLKMIVRNVGNSPALNINMIIEPKINNPFSNIEFLAPNRELSSIIKFIFHKNSDEPENTKYKFSISYEDTYKYKYNNEYNIDISPLLNSTNFCENENKEIVEKLDKMLTKFDNLKNELSNISSSSKNQADYIKDIKNKLR